jgi:hypothetical protein
MAAFVVGGMVWRAFVALTEGVASVARHGRGDASHWFIVRGCLFGFIFKLFLCVCHDLLPLRLFLLRFLGCRFSLRCLLGRFAAFSWQKC